VDLFRNSSVVLSANQPNLSRREKGTFTFTNSMAQCVFCLKGHLRLNDLKRLTAKKEKSGEKNLEPYAEQFIKDST